MRRRTALDWSRRFADLIGKPSLEGRDMSCRGCAAATEFVFVGCARCAIRSCCEQRNLATCADCAEFESCPSLQSFFGQNPQARGVLERMRIKA